MTWISNQHRGAIIVRNKSSCSNRLQPQAEQKEFFLSFFWAPLPGKINKVQRARTCYDSNKMLILA